MNYVDGYLVGHYPDEKRSSLDRPYVSVLMPVRNESRFIAASLEAVLSQDYPHNRMEVLIADGMSTDDTREIISRVAALYPAVSVRIVDNHGRIASSGLNAALQQARGDVIIRVDGHTFLDPDHVQQCVEVLERSGADHVGGRMETVSEGPFGEAVSWATSTSFGVGHGRFHYSDHEEWSDTVSMGAWPRQVFERIGLFDEEQVRNQDDEFNYRLLEQGGRILLSPSIRSKYYNRSTPRSLWRQYYQYGYWKVRVMQKHPSQMRPRQFAPPLLAASILFCTLLLPFSSVAVWGIGLILGSYGLANLCASVLTARQAGWHLLPRLSLAFSVLHLSYGFGFLVGLVKFWNRWHDRGEWIVLRQG
ncbi:glycosyltransferase family 2 protein [Microvirga sp. CF3016]|uniref:glycosyltransferase family 2 protein n=1 Tax=Microvirga sp. CF3016 TaxID=3110181 RepID=UPI002E769868|nr:glycosyltransferase family 2 protein [Microvirga sp. CF3016]MEE1612164.1 glycosyltransferase family 2 protein [Microvirga sp. CF3016]